MKIDLENELQENEKIITKAIKLRIYPNAKQKELINKNIGCARFMYNFCLNKQREKDKMWYIVNEMVQQGYFSENNYKGEKFNVNDMDKWNTALKKDKNYKWLKKADKYALQNAIKDLGEAYQKVYSKQGGKPKFRSKKESEQSYRTNYTETEYDCKNGSKGISENIYLTRYAIKLPKIEKIKIKKQDFPKRYNILNVTVIRSKSNKYYASVTIQTIVKIKNKTNKSVGVDLGIKNYITLSNGDVKLNPKFLKKEQERIANIQRVLSRKTSGSKNWWKVKSKLAKLHEQVTNRRYNYIQNLTTELVTKYDIICIEDLNTKQMYQNKDVANLLSEVPFYEFKRQLKYKAEWYDKQVVEVDRYYPSSQLCSNCGFKYKEVKDLNLREWTCPKCGKHHDRDLNASINILNEGLKNLNNLVK